MQLSQGPLEVCPSGPGGELASAVAGQVMLLTVGLVAPEPRYRKRPDQLPQGVAGCAVGRAFRGGGCSLSESD